MTKKQPTPTGVGESASRRRLTPGVMMPNHVEPACTSHDPGHRAPISIREGRWCPGPEDVEVALEVHDDGRVDLDAAEFRIVEAWNHDPERLEATWKAWGRAVLNRAHGVVVVPGYCGGDAFSLAALIEQSPCVTTGDGDLPPLPENFPVPRLGAVWGRNAAGMRRAAGLSPHQVTEAVRRRGLDWCCTDVESFERGSMSPTLDMLVAYCLALTDAGCAEATLPRLLECADRLIAMNDNLWVTDLDLIRFATGHPLEDPLSRPLAEAEPTSRHTETNP
jgi:hypothetical protein